MVGVVSAGVVLSANVKQAFILDVPVFDSVSRAKADEAVDRIVAEHQKLVMTLIAQLRTAKTDEAKIYVVYTLGTLRAKQAVGDLVRIIDLEAKGYGPGPRIGRWGPYPAQEALSKIGSPSVGPLVTLLGTDKDKTRRKLMLMVLVDVLQKDVAHFVLEKASKGAPEAQRPLYEEVARMLGRM